MKPVTPQEIAHYRKEIPWQVFAVVNELLKGASGPGKQTFEIQQSDIVDRLVKNGFVSHSQELFQNKWLDFEDHYRDVGWQVSYHKPPYFGDWKPYFQFRIQ